jgi:hypothetical protein
MQLTKLIRDQITKTKSNQLTFGMMFVLVSAILIPYLFQISYAQTVSVSSPSLKFFRIKAAVDKNVIPRGQEQTVQVSVEDAKSHAPIAGAIVRLTVVYPGGTPIRQVSGFTDTSGQATISWRIEGNAPLDTYTTRFDVFLVGYAEETFTGTFAVIAHGVNDGNHNDNNDHHHKHKDKHHD